MFKIFKRKEVEARKQFEVIEAWSGNRVRSIETFNREYVAEWFINEIFPYCGADYPMIWKRHLKAVEGCIKYGDEVKFIIREVVA